MSRPLIFEGQISPLAITYAHLSEEVRALLGETTIQIFEMENKSAVTTVPGMPVARHASGSGCIPASANSASGQAVGVVLTGSAPGYASVVQTIGRIALLDWTAITGTTELSPLGTYFLSPDAGQFTLIPPTTGGTYVQCLGDALSAQVLELRVMPPIRN